MKGITWPPAFLRTCHLLEGGRAGANGGRVIKFYVAKKGGGGGHQKFKMGFGKGHTIFNKHCCHLR